MFSAPGVLARVERSATGEVAAEKILLPLDADGGSAHTAWHRVRGSAGTCRVVWPVTGARGRRKVSIDPLTVRELKAHKARQAAERLVVESDWQDSDLVFRTAFGAPVFRDTPSQLLPKLIDQYDDTHRDEPLPRIRLHDLRHIHATTLLLAGEPVHVVAARLGHADPSITLRVFARDPAPGAGRRRYVCPGGVGRREVREEVRQTGRQEGCQEGRR